MSRAQINRYIFREILAPTLLCLLIFTVVLLMGRLMKMVDLVVNKGVALADICTLFATLMPAFLSISLPLAFLMGIMIGLGRMSADGETIALKASGVGLLELGRPVFALAIIFAVLSGVSGLWAKPWGYRAFKEKVFEITREKATIGIRPQVFMDQFDNMVLYTDRLDERSGTLSGLFIVEKAADETSMIFAEEGRIVTDDQAQNVGFRLQNGIIHRRQSTDSGYQLIRFRRYDLQPELTGADTPSLGTSRRKPKELSTAELLDPGNLQDVKGSASALAAELHSRLSTPLAPLLFALFGLPFGIQSQRSGKSGGFTMGLLIYLCYYLLLSLAETVTAESGVSPWLTFWLPHLVLGLAGIHLLRQSNREQPNFIVMKFEQTLHFVRTRYQRYENR